MNDVVLVEEKELDDSDRLTRDNLIKVVRNEGIPRCFESRKQYDDWLDQERTAATEPFRRNVCEDCTRSFKMMMCSMNRCVNRHQKVTEDAVDIEAILGS